MSFLDKLKGFEHTFTGWVAKEYQKLNAAEPKIEAIADATFKYAIPAVQLVAAATGNEAAAALIGGVAAEAQADLHAASGLIYDFGANPTAGSIVAGVMNNLQALLTAGHVTNVDSQAKVAKVIGSLGALAAALPQVQAAAAATPTA